MLNPTLDKDAAYWIAIPSNCTSRRVVILRTGKSPEDFRWHIFGDEHEYSTTAIVKIVRLLHPVDIYKP